MSVPAGTILLFLPVFRYRKNDLFYKIILWRMRRTGMSDFNP